MGFGIGDWGLVTAGRGASMSSGKPWNALCTTVLTGPANSTLIRNAVEDLLGEDFEGRFESKY
ncbi:hypothetical protein, partial [Xanthomonas oryzae]|uniref:hypothetical protein n=1 Tax=Xanthomonas oryzae TaxID=347 RepID=UPI003CEBE7EE